MLELLIVVAAGLAGYFLARNFVRRRLRFVDAVHSPFAPVIAGSVAALLMWPATLLPLVTLTTALVFGIGTGLGTASGSRALKQTERQRRLAP
jgi:CHASE2 domain-containing sensor protein